MKNVQLMMYNTLKQYGLKNRQEFMFSDKFLSCYYCMVDLDDRFFVNIDGKWYESSQLGIKFMNNGGQVIMVNVNEYQHCPKVYEPHQYT